ncbi:Maf family protein [Alteromonas sp. RKMC-009]|uniref:Maf family protein n=1 Tax=Alteromonas sp. RKMC-009 TaxID=2267264 RepID=UPI000E696F6F|nr:Maf family protein [Alteromonas sp. RKMC-009]AYA66016.1 septum formation inhibitor Maf [Alteromonas sp. RKMC-009]
MSAQLILASASPRRTALLDQMGFAHRQFPVDIDESPLDGESPETMVTRLAAEKARVASERLNADADSSYVVLASDTLIAFQGRPLGKPADRDDCFATLRALSDKEHEVLTAVSIYCGGKSKTLCVCTKVLFAPVTDDDIAAYWETGEPADKAGSYAIQGIGGQFVRSVSGSVSSVIGLPLYETRCLLKEFGISS